MKKAAVVTCGYADAPLAIAGPCSVPLTSKQGPCSIINSFWEVG